MNTDNTSVETFDPAFAGFFYTPVFYNTTQKQATAKQNDS
jgi:hypothetical protein